MSASEPQQLGDFTVVEKIGQGAMGSVYKARQTSLNRHVALKLLPAHLAGDPDFLARFKHESMAAAALNHPNVVQIYAAGHDDGTHYFAMEYVEGESFGARLERKGRIDPREALAVTHYVAQALDYAWKKARIIHRDIKPDNIFLSREGTVKLGDLGLAKVLGSQAAGLTQTGASMGTPYYVSPEQALGTGEIDFRSDIYSLGCTIYHTISGRTPYRGDSGMSVMLQHISQPPPQIQTVWPECPPAIVGLLDRMLRKKPEERHESYEALLTNLHSTIERLDEPAAAGASMVIQSPAAAVSSATPKHATSAPAASAVAVSKPARRKTWMLFAVIGLFTVAAGAAFVWQPWKKSAQPALRSGSDALKPNPAKSDLSGGPVAAAPAPESTGIAPVLISDTNVAGATKEQPFVNSLGMKFVPVPIIGGPSGGQRMLFSVWETRVGDCDAYCQETGLKWPKMPFAQSPAHPVGNISIPDAQGFCDWLTARERKLGRIGATEKYRLPTDHEWSCAVGIGDREDSAKTPRDKSEQIADVFPWGTNWPPPTGAGNYGDEAGKKANPSWKASEWKVIEGYNDGFADTAPVGSFAVNQFGLYDLGGNLWEWCIDFYDGKGGDRVLRGASYYFDARNFLLSSFRISRGSQDRRANHGFRCVIETAPPNANLATTTPKNATPAPSTPSPATVPVAKLVPAPTPLEDGFVSLLDTDHPEEWKHCGQGGITLKDGVATTWVEANKGNGCSWYGKKQFTDFILKLEFRIETPNANSGVYVRFPDPGTNPQVADQRGYQIDVSEEPNPLEMTGAICFTKAPTSVPQKARDWNELEINAVGQHYLIKLNGTLVNDFTGSRQTSGYIGLQNIKVGGVQYRNLRIKELTPSTAQTTVPVASTPPPITAPSGDLNSTARWKNAINLLPSIDLAADTVSGTFASTPEGLVTGRSGVCALELPYRPPAEYDFRMSFTYKDGVGEFCQILSKGGRSFEWILGGNGNFFGFQVILGKNATQNPTSKRFRLDKNRKYTSLVQVRNDGLKSYLEDVPISEWKTNYGDMGVWPHWKLRDDTRIGIGTNSTLGVIHSVEVLEVTGQGQLIRPARTSTSAPVNPTSSLVGNADRTGFVSLFNGRDLTGWEGDPQYWSVKSGAITAESPVNGRVPTNTFLIWKGGKLTDFELRLSYKITAGNSGVQYRSRVADASVWKVFGYQFEIDAEKRDKNGGLYEEGGQRKGLGGNAGGTLMANVGENVRMTPDDKKQMIGSLKGVPQFHSGTWNELVITAQGNHITQQLNGTTTIELTDDDTRAQALSGVLALQLHAGSPQKVQFKDIRLRPLTSP